MAPAAHRLTHAQTVAWWVAMVVAVVTFAAVNRLVPSTTIGEDGRALIALTAAVVAASLCSLYLPAFDRDSHPTDPDD